MAQPTQHILKRVGILEVTKGVPYSGAAIVDGNVMEMGTEGVRVTFNSTGSSYPAPYLGTNFVDASTTYTFDQDCVIAIGSMVEVT